VSLEEKHRIAGRPTGIVLDLAIQIAGGLDATHERSTGISEVYRARDTRVGQALCRTGNAAGTTGKRAGDGGRRQGLRHGGFRARVPEPLGDAARGAKPWAKRRQAPLIAAPRSGQLCHQPEEEEAHRRMFWLAEDHCVDAQSAASRNAESRLDLHVCLCGLQLGTHAEPDAQRSSDVVRPGRSSERR
jgi:hypothetical protein